MTEETKREICKSFAYSIPIDTRMFNIEKINAVLCERMDDIERRDTT